LREGRPDAGAAESHRGRQCEAASGAAKHMSGAALREEAPETLGQILGDTRSLAGNLASGAAARDRDRELPFAAFEQVRAARIGTLRVPERFGGPGGSVADVIEAVTTLASAEPNVAHSL